MKKESDFLNNIVENRESKEDIGKGEKILRKNVSNPVSIDKRIQQADADIRSAVTRVQETLREVKNIRERLGLLSCSEELPGTRIEKINIKKLEAQKSKLEQEKQKERQEIANGFARELRETLKGTFYQKLKKLAGAFVLAGLSIFEPGQAIAPELTKQAKVLMEVERQYELVLSNSEKGDALRKKIHPKGELEMDKSGLFKFPLDPKRGMEKIQKVDTRLYRDILNQFQEKGGVLLSSQLPETVYRQDRFSEIVQVVSLEVNPPFYNRPEVILGKEFIAKNPEKAKEYLEKISKAMRATVQLEREGEAGLGSGVFIKRKDQVFVLTNEHVVGDSKFLKMGFFDEGGVLMQTKVQVLAKDKESDIAVLTFPGNKKDLRWTKELVTLPIGEKTSVKDKEKIATIGHAFGFPYTVGIAEAIRIPGSNALLSRRDRRFSALELYSEFLPDRKEINPFFKGDTISGMSGGPVISLDQHGDPKLAGLNSMTIGMHKIGEYYQDKDFEGLSFQRTKIHNFYETLKKAGHAKENRIGKMVTSDEITTFLKKYNLYE